MTQEYFFKAADLNDSICRLFFDISAAEREMERGSLPNLFQFATPEQKQRFANEVLESMKARLAELEKQFDEL